MDPDANLKEQIELANYLVDEHVGVPSGDVPQKAARLAELVLAMNEWIRKGGRLPLAWTAHQLRPKRDCIYCHGGGVVETSYDREGPAIGSRCKCLAGALTP